MSNDTQFVDGMIIKAPRTGAPDFIKGSISIRPGELIEWLGARKQEEWVNLDIKESRNGKWYAQVNTWKPEEKSEVKKQPVNDGLPHVDYPEEDIDFDQIPF